MAAVTRYPKNVGEAAAEAAEAAEETSTVSAATVAAASMLSTRQASTGKRSGRDSRWS